MYGLRVEKSTPNQDDTRVWVVGLVCFFLLMGVQYAVIQVCEPTESKEQSQ